MATEKTTSKNAKSTSRTKKAADATKTDVPSTGTTTATMSEQKTPVKKPTKKPDGKLSALAAAAKVLGESNEPLTTKQMIEAMAAKGYWTSPNGQTPAQTLYSALLREINVKGRESRFQKTERGKFAPAASK